MKARSSFVTNSSSSSFICDSTGEIFSGFDASMSDFYLYRCENSHTCHIEEFIGFDEDSVEFKQELIKKQIKNCEEQILFYKEKLKDSKNEKYFNSYKEWIDRKKEQIVELNSFDDLINIPTDEIDEEWAYSVPAKYCPICSFKVLTNDDALSYLYKKYSIAKKDLLKEIKDKFNSYEEFTRYLK